MRALLAGLVAGLTLCAAVPDTTRLALPAPTGRLHVGNSSFPLVDESRDDPWQPTEKRELMVTVWYPTAVPAGRHAPYLTPAESKAFIDFQRDQGVPIAEDLPDDVLTTTRTHAVAGAPPLPRPGGRPLVLLSPGFSLPRVTLSGLAEDLASHGYVVAAVDHAYESSGTAFPGGLKTCLACDQADPEQIPSIRTADVSFVLDHLTSSTGG